MFEELDRLINFIQKEYIEFNEKWKKSNYYYKQDYVKWEKENKGGENIW